MKNSAPIIPVSVEKCHSKDWKIILKNAISNPVELFERLDIDFSQTDYAIDSGNNFAMRVPEPFVAKMEKGNPKDPLLLQVISQQLENIQTPEFSQDPLGEGQFLAPGLLHKYHGRVLLILSSACAVNCRYCFRRHFPYQENQASGHQLTQAIDYIKSDTSISEVILSGGDPLMLGDSQLESLFCDLGEITHVKRLRIHTRLPVVIPQRITDHFVQLFQNKRFDYSMVLHINHAKEIDDLFSHYLEKLSHSNITLFNQSVLLKDINDSSNALIELSELLFKNRIVPYYIHLLDKVSGAAHFEVNENQAKKLLHNIRNSLPGYLVPRLAREEVGVYSKTIIV
ncbi:MAG: EF-P beta-lysylation protein EpmB [Gammaproteobacteria bacterium]|nr:EF-P beta-lysylation protein EpmB [Gammaproteobacteria bacterium]MDH5629926.1 EF-P beta-lysylation protein EpmB [Gammaproteobacteria bacterium]